MADLDIPAIAASVATALGLDERRVTNIYTNESYMTGWIESPRYHMNTLDVDGLELIYPYWRCACLDWLNEQGYDVLTARHHVHSAMLYDKIPGGYMITVKCPAALAPAALVHEVMKARG